MEDIKAKKMKSVAEVMDEMPEESVLKSLEALDELKEQGVVVAGGYAGIGKSLLLEQLKEAGQTIDKGEEVLFEDKRTLEDIVKEIAKEEGLTSEQAMAMFRQGLREANNVAKVDPKKKKKARAKNKMAKKSRKRNR